MKDANGAIHEVLQAHAPVAQAQSAKDPHRQSTTTEERGMWESWYNEMRTFAEEHGVKVARKTATVAHPELLVMDSIEERTFGAIIDARGYKTLVRAIPVQANGDDRAIYRYCTQNVGDYDIYRAVDGTRVTLYFHDGEWLMSTARAFDVRTMRWMGSKTYYEAFVECAREFDFGALDRSMTYSFIFHHCDFHPLKGDPQKLWQIDGPAIRGIDQHMPMSASERMTAEQMRVTASNALIEYANTGIVNHGYLFRLRDKGAGASQPRLFFLESSLHAIVRKHIYDIPPTIGLDNDSRVTYVHLRAFLSESNATSHVMMFPQAAELYKKMSIIISIIVNLVATRMRAKLKAPNGLQPDVVINNGQAHSGAETFGRDWGRVSALIGDVSKDVHSAIMRRGDIGAFGDHVLANIRDFCMDTYYIEQYMRVLEPKWRAFRGRGLAISKARM
jgi:hypothetical protein